MKDTSNAERELTETAASADDAVVSEAAKDFAVDLARRAAAIAHGGTQPGEPPWFPSELTRRINTAEARARSLARAGGGSEESRRGAALDFLASAVGIFVLAGKAQSEGLGEVVAGAAAAIGVSRSAANLAVFQRALSSADASRLPPPLAYQFAVELIVELAPAEAVSLWTAAGAARLECKASAGDAAASRRMRVAARALLDANEAAVTDPATYIRAVAVHRWDRTHAVLVARGRPASAARLLVFLREAANVLSPSFERESLFDRNADRENTLVSAGERRLIRLGCDLHDGPLQDVVSLADDLRRARAEVSTFLDSEEAARVVGRLDDLEARLVALDQSLRDISQAVRSTGPAERPLEETLRNEIASLNRSGDVHARLAIDGDLGGLTASQKIVLARVVQETLSNVRRHCRAARVRIRVRSSARYVSVSVSDDGCGFDVESARRSGRLGLTGVIERVRLLGGEIEIDSAPGCGTRVRATLPRWSHAGERVTSVYAVTA